MGNEPGREAEPALCEQLEDLRQRHGLDLEQLRGAVKQLRWCRGQIVLAQLRGALSGWRERLAAQPAALIAAGQEKTIQLQVKLGVREAAIGQAEARVRELEGLAVPEDRPSCSAPRSAPAEGVRAEIQLGIKQEALERAEARVGELEASLRAHEASVQQIRAGLISKLPPASPGSTGRRAPQWYKARVAELEQLVHWASRQLEPAPGTGGSPGARVIELEESLEAVRDALNTGMPLPTGPAPWEPQLAALEAALHKAEAEAAAAKSEAQQAKAEAEKAIACAAEAESRQEKTIEARPLPEGWEAIWDSNHSRYYYFAASTGESMWEIPEHRAQNSQNQEGGLPKRDAGKKPVKPKAAVDVSGEQAEIQRLKQGAPGELALALPQEDASCGHLEQPVQVGALEAASDRDQVTVEELLGLRGELAEARIAAEEKAGEAAAARSEAEAARAELAALEADHSALKEEIQELNGFDKIIFRQAGEDQPASCGQNELELREREAALMEKDAWVSMREWRLNEQVDQHYRRQMHQAAMRNCRLVFASLRKDQMRLRLNAWREQHLEVKKACYRELAVGCMSWKGISWRGMDSTVKVHEQARETAINAMEDKLHYFKSKVRRAGIKNITQRLVYLARGELGVRIQIWRDQKEQASSLHELEKDNETRIKHLERVASRHEAALEVAKSRIAELEGELEEARQAPPLKFTMMASRTTRIFEKFQE